MLNSSHSSNNSKMGAMGEVKTGEVRTGEVRTGEVKMGEVRPLWHIITLPSLLQRGPVR
jgi:hypothetical protein